MNGSHPTMKNGEGTNGTRNRPLRGRGRSFQFIEAPRGRPFLVRRRFIATGLALPKIIAIVEFSWETLLFQRIANHLVSEGTVTFPPQTAP
jgi:hypothetical protein